MMKRPRLNRPLCVSMLALAGLLVLSPYQGRDRQRIPRLNPEIPKPVQRPTWWRTGGDRR
jgi:hypothetical protein